MFAPRSRSAPVKFLVLRVTLGTVKSPVAIVPIAIFGYKLINEMINEYRVIPGIRKFKLSGNFFPNFTKNVFDFYLTYL
jgi:hypothetical protein